MYRILVLLLSFTLFSCSNGENKIETNVNSSSEDKNEPKTAPATQAPDQVYLPSISLDEVQILWDNCNQVDYIYYELPISTSLNDQYSIQQGLRHISEAPVPLSFKKRCKAISRVFYKNEGEDLIEAEIYFSPGCSFFVFFKEGKPAYSNLMTEAGVMHFNDILEKALSLQPKQ